MSSVSLITMSRRASLAVACVLLSATPAQGQEQGAPLAGQEWSVLLGYNWSDGGSWTFVFQPDGCIDISLIGGGPGVHQSCALQYAVTEIDRSSDGSATADIVFSYEDFVYFAGRNDFLRLRGSASGDTRCSGFSVPEIGADLTEPSCAMPPMDGVQAEIVWTVTRTR